MSNLVLVRHGQSLWNRERRFTGWSNVPLTPKGEAEARAVGEMLQARGLRFDVAYTSVLDRAFETLRILLGILGQERIPVHRSWRLNERHYGIIQGMSRPETVRRFGFRQLIAWQSGYHARPPPVAVDDARYPRHDDRYAALPDAALPRTESMQDTLERVLPYWREVIAPDIVGGKRVLVVAHKTSLRALRKHLEGIGDQDIAALTLRTGEPIVYRLDGDARVLGHQSLRPAHALKRWTQAGMGKWLRTGTGKGRK